MIVSESEPDFQSWPICQLQVDCKLARVSRHSPGSAAPGKRVGAGTEFVTQYINIVIFIHPAKLSQPNSLVRRSRFSSRFNNVEAPALPIPSSSEGLLYRFRWYQGTSDLG